MPRIISLLILLQTVTAYGQMPAVYFNHAFVVLDTADYNALRTNSFIRNELAGFQTRSTISNGNGWTGSYIYGTDNYLELFEASTSQHDLGTAALATSVDGEGELLKVDSILNKTYPATIEERQRKVAGKMTPWFDCIYINDTAFFNTSAISFWIMEYRSSYFDSAQLQHQTRSVSRKEYLAQYGDSLKGKCLKHFTAITFNATKEEENYFAELLRQCGLTQSAKHTFVTADKFSIRFRRKKTSAHYALSQLAFETFRPCKKIERVTQNIKIVVAGTKGRILFE
ncbi:MAG: DUF5829 family protein [Chitinophagales bacterium]